MYPNGLLHPIPSPCISPSTWISVGESFLPFLSNLFHIGQACGCLFHARVNQDEPMLLQPHHRHIVVQLGFQCDRRKTEQRRWQSLFNQRAAITLYTRCTAHRTAALTPLLTPTCYNPCTTISQMKTSEGKENCQTVPRK